MHIRSLLALLVMLVLVAPLTACSCLQPQGDPTLEVRLPVVPRMKPMVEPTGYGMLVPAAQAPAQLMALQQYQLVQPAPAAAPPCGPAAPAPAYSTPYNWAPPPVPSGPPCR
jgi:hypothetical protein